MHSSNTFITRLGLYNHIVLVWRTLAWLCRESLQQPARLNIEIHENVIDSTNYHAKHSYRWRCITCVQNWQVKDYAHISTSVMTWLQAK